MRRRTRFTAVVAAVAAAVVLAACGGGSAGDKAGGEAGQVTLRLGAEHGSDRPAAAQMQQFARQVQELSKGQVRIEPVWEVSNTQDDWDQVVARMVIRGELQMGMVPARSWDTEGVTSLRALHAPFLVTSEQVTNEIVKGALATEMLAGLERVGVTGLALYPEGLRHLFAYGDPPLSLADFDGKLIRAPRSETTYALFEALGAKGDDFGADAAREDEAVKAGRVVAAESSFALATTLGESTTAVGNLTLFPKVNSLVINSKAFEALTDEQRAVLRDAAARTLGLAVGSTRIDADLAKEYCSNGGKIAAVSQANLVRLQQAAQPVYDRLEQDGPTKAMIARIRSLGGGAGATQAAVTACPAKAPAQAAPAGGTATSFPEGVYRVEITEAFLLQAGVNSVDAKNHAAISTLTFRNGEFNAWDTTLQGQADPNEPTCPGSAYSVEGDRVSVKLGQGGPGCGSVPGEELFNARWTLQGKQLRFMDVRTQDSEADLLLKTLLGGKPFTKIG